MRRILLTVLSAFACCLILSFMNSQAGSHHAPSLSNDQSAVRGLYAARANQVTGKFSSIDLQEAIKEADDRIGTRSVSLTWNSLGPDNIGGRTTAIAYDQTRPGWVYAGGVSGGLWKSTNGGNSWQPVSSVFQNTSISSLTQASDGNIYAGTGEVLNGIAGGAPSGNSAFAFPGYGIYKLNVGDTVWNLLPSTIPSDYNSPNGDWNFVTSIVVSPSNASMIYAGTAKGIQISTDGGASWTKATHSTSSQPFDTSIVYSLTIGGDGFVYANVANTYWRSSQPNGTDFTFQTGVGSFPSGNFGNIKFAVSGLNPQYVYAAISDAALLTGNLFGIYQSKDDGTTWRVMVQGGSATFEPLNGVGPNSTTIAVIPNDTTSLFMGGHDLFKYSNQFGWNQVSSQFFLNNYIPIGINIVVFNPTNPGDILIGCDQGIYRSVNANEQYPDFFSVTRNYNVTQCYSADIGTNNFVLAGTEGTGAILNDTSGNTSQSFATLVGGSCGYVTIPRTDNIAALVDLTQDAPSLLRFSNLTTGVASGFFDIRIDADGNGVPDEGIDWLAPYDLYESSAGSILAYGTNKAIWVCPNPLNFSADANWFRLILAPQTTDAAVTCVSFSNDGNSVFAGTKNGTVYRFDHVFDALVQGKYVYPSITSKIWNPDSNGITVTSTNILPGRYLRSIAVDPTNSNNIIVTAANYGNSSYVWRSTNALSVPIAFSDITGNLPKMPVWSAAIDQVNPNLVVLGTDLGLWAQDLSDGAGWQEANNGLPRVPVLQVRERSLNDHNYMFAASFGRGVFQSNDLGMTISGVDNSLHVSNSIKVFPDPVSEFANVSMTLQKNASVAIDVRTSGGDLIRHLENNFSKGEHSLQINFQDVANGIYFISVTAGGVISNKKIIVIH